MGLQNTMYTMLTVSINVLKNLVLMWCTSGRSKFIGTHLFSNQETFMTCFIIEI